MDARGARPREKLAIPADEQDFLGGAERWTQGRRKKDHNQGDSKARQESDQGPSWSEV